MKSTFMLIVLLVSQFSYSKSLHEKKNKQEMIDRVQSIISNISGARLALEKEDPSKACESIYKIFQMYPDHLMGIGTRMNLLDRGVSKIENESKSQLIYFHQLSNTCDRGERGEHLDMESVDKNFKSIVKKLEKQKKKIQKSDTDYENIYNYYYEF